MNTPKKQAGLVFGLGLILSAIRTFLITNTMEKNSDLSNSYYLPDGNVWVIAFSVIAVLFALFIVFMAFRSGKRVVAPDHTGSTAPASLILGFLLVGASLIYFFSDVSVKLESGTLMKIVVVLAVLSAIAFIVIGFRSKTSKTLLAVLTILPIAFSAFRLLADFTSSSATPLASSGAYHILGLCAVLLYFFCEGKAYVDICFSRTYLLFGYLSIFLLLVYALPYFILNCFGVFVFDYTAGFAAVDVGIAIYISVRIVTAKFEKSSEENKSVTE